MILVAAHADGAAVLDVHFDAADSVTEAAKTLVERHDSLSAFSITDQRDVVIADLERVLDDEVAARRTRCQNLVSMMSGAMR